MISAPTLRPRSVGFAFLIRLRAGELVEIDRSARRREPFGFAHHAQRFFDRGAQGPLDDHQVAEHALADRHGLDLAELEGEGADDVALLRLAHRAEELPGLAVVIGEALGADALLVARLLLRVGRKAAFGALARPGRIEAVRLVGDASGGNVLALDAVALEVAHRAARPVDLELVEIRPAEPDELGVGVGEQPALQQRVVGEVDARHHVAGVEGDLLGLGEEVVDVAVEHHLADDLERDVFLGDQFGGVEHVELERVGGFLVEGLNTELPLGEIAARDRVEQVAAMEIRIGAADLARLVPEHRSGAGDRPPVELHECRFALGRR